MRQFAGGYRRICLQDLENFSLTQAASQPARPVFVALKIFPVETSPRTASG
jgi:hypothetical protein